MSENSRRVFVVDDDVAVLRGLSALLAAVDYRVEIFRSGEEFLKATETTPPEGAALLLDVCMPGIKGPELQEHLVRAGVRMPVIVMTANGDVPTAVRAMRNGAVDFLEKPFTPDALMEALNRAFDAEASSQSPHGAADDAERARFAALSKREREVLRDVVSGSTSKEIARRLKLSPRTVEAHRRNLMVKLSANSFAELVRRAVAAGAA